MASPAAGPPSSFPGSSAAGGGAPPFDPRDQGGTRLNIIIWLLCSLAAIFMFLRMYCKYITHRRLWWDDYVLIGSWVSYLAPRVSVNMGLTDS
jgi:hypothetical protein